MTFPDPPGGAYPAAFDEPLVTTGETPSLVFHVSDQGSRAAVVVESLGERRQVEAVFPARWADTTNATLPVSADVWYSRGYNVGNGWPEWHVKVYRCRDVPSADALDRYLRDQAKAVGRANRALPGNAEPMEPPWGIVPSFIVRGNQQQSISENGVATRLGAPTSAALAPDGADMVPRWFAASNTDAERIVVALTPWVQPVNFPDYARNNPAAENLHLFGNLAKVLDRIHEIGMFHCDIKPDNVMNAVHTGETYYALIDTDAVAFEKPPPQAIRYTRRYAHREVIDTDQKRAQGKSYHFSATTLRAHDRFAFALLVLSALAGHGWVQDYILPEYEPDRRVADEPQRIVSALVEHWPDAQWRALIDTLVRPFSSALLGAENWSAEAWLHEVRTSYGNRTPTTDPTDDETVLRPRTVDLARWQASFARIRDAASRNTTNPQARIAAGSRAIAAEAVTVASHAARRTAGWIAFAIAVVAAVITIGVVVGK